MDKSVPLGAAMLLDFIGDIEAPQGYGTIYGNKQGKLPKPLTSMTLGEVVDAQKAWSKNHGSSAAGRYQFMRATLQELSQKLNLAGNMRFDADLQDRLGYYLLKRRGYDDYMAGKIGPVEFGKRLAQEWASLPVLAATKGGVKDKNGKPRTVTRGQSFYAGDGLNKLGDDGATSTEMTKGGNVLSGTWRMMGRANAAVPNTDSRVTLALRIS